VLRSHSSGRGCRGRTVRRKSKENKLLTSPEVRGQMRNMGDGTAYSVDPSSVEGLLGIPQK
jgi:hypothetical protein